MAEPPQKRVKSEASPSSGLPPLPPGWTEHTAPTGHKYYYNKATKKSTYTRPAIELPHAVSQETVQSTNSSDAYSASPAANYNVPSYSEQYANWNTHGQGSQNPVQNGQAPYAAPEATQTVDKPLDQSSYRPRFQLADRPKRKETIPNCGPWVLVYTKLGRRFVHNLVTRESYWKFPEDVMKAVIALDQMQLDEKLGKAPQANGKEEKASKSTTVEDIGIDEQEIAKHKSQVATSFQREQEEDAALLRGNEEERVWVPPAQSQAPAYDSSEYEEIEVTDDSDLDSNADAEQDDDSPAGPHDGPLEFNEEDIAYQLAAMEADQLAQMEEEYPPSEHSDSQSPPDDEEDDDGASREAIFFQLLDQHAISPFTPWATLLADPSSALLADPSFTVLPSSRLREAAHAKWAKQAIAARRAAPKPAAAPPREAFLAFLAERTRETAKLYWTEFRRKHKKETALRVQNRWGEKDMEKLYREYVARQKAGLAEREEALRALVKEGRDFRGEVAFWVVPKGRREEIVEA